MKPCKNITIALNEDTEIVLEYNKRKIADGENSVDTKHLIKSSLKRVIRSLYSLVIEQDMSWSENLYENIEIFHYYFPDEKRILRVKELLEDNNVDKDEVIFLLEYYKQWISTQLRKIK